MSVTRRALVAMAVLAGCTSGNTLPPAPSTTDDPGVEHQMQLGPLTPAMAPSASPTQAGTNLVASAVPTNQWWTSALTGPWSQPLWAYPIVATATAGGLVLGAAGRVEVEDDSIRTPLVDGPVVGGRLSGVEVVDYGDFSVRLELQRAAGEPLTVDLAQGSPTVSVSVPDGAVTIGVDREASVVDAVGFALGDPLDAESTNPTVAVGNGVTIIDAQGGWWYVRSSASAAWTRTGDELSVVADDPILLTFAPLPTDAEEDWRGVIDSMWSRPIRTTTSAVSVDWTAGVVRQTLTWERAGDGGGIAVLLPHQRDGVVNAVAMDGSFPSANGPLSMVRGDSVTVEYPIGGMLLGVPQVELGPEATAEITAALAVDLAAPDDPAGSYGSAKSLGRLALLAEIAHATGDASSEQAALDRLELGLADWAGYDGPDDTRWLALEPTWGGVVAAPPEFGLQDYNDHHFQYGYVIRAAATLAAYRPGTTTWLQPMAALLVDDVIGGANGLPPFRVFNAYLGYSQASGFAPFADGNNQESSSEAVHAWEAIARWATVVDDETLLEQAVARYAIEANSANRYWLGSDGFPDGFDHSTAGIVWSGKVDFATWFDERPEAAIGIQLLPFTFGSLYRAGDRGAGAVARVAEATAAGLTLWPDLFAMEAAIADPDEASAMLSRVAEYEAGNSRALALYWINSLGQLGRPTTDFRATSPFGTAFDREGSVSFAGVNPGVIPRTVTFVDERGTGVASIELPASTAVSVLHDAD